MKGTNPVATHTYKVGLLAVFSLVVVLLSLLTVLIWMQQEKKAAGVSILHVCLFGRSYTSDGELITALIGRKSDGTLT